MTNAPTTAPAAPTAPDGHGTLYSYKARGCRCLECKRANADDAKKRRELRRLRGPLPEGDPRHGTANGYNYWGCRCAPCQNGNRASQAARRDRAQDRGRDKIAGRVSTALAERPRKVYKEPASRAGRPSTRVRRVVEPLPPELLGWFDVTKFIVDVRCVVHDRYNTIASLSVRLGVPYEKLRHILNGWTAMSMDMAARLALFCDLRLDDYVREGLVSSEDSS